MESLRTPKIKRTRPSSQMNRTDGFTYKSRQMSEGRKSLSGLSTASTKQSMGSSTGFKYLNKKEKTNPFSGDVRYANDHAFFKGAIPLEDHQKYESRSYRNSSNPAHMDMRTVKSNFDLSSANKISTVTPREALELKEMGKIT